jgi:hypothetical protein
MIKTVLGFAYLLILALLGLLVLVGGAVVLVRLIRWLASMSHDDLERFYMARQSPKRLHSYLGFGMALAGKFDDTALV